MSKHPILLSVIAGAALAGCGMSEVRRDTDNQHRRVEHKAKEHIQDMPANRQPYRSLRVSETPWLGVREVVREKDPREGLPAAFSQDITLIFPDRVNLSTIAERITEVTTIPVKLRPDVFVRASTLLPQAAATLQPLGSNSNQAAVGTDGVQGLATSSASSDYELTATLNYTGSLIGLLDMLAAKTGTSWKYENGAIVWYRFVTKTFTLRSTPGSSEMATAIGKSGGAQTGGAGTGGGSSFSSDASVRMASEFSVWKNVKESIEAMLSPVGRVAVTEATGTVTVTDTQYVIDEVETMMEELNKALTRQVAIRVEVLSVSGYKSDEHGLDVQALFTKYLANGDENWGFSFGAPNSVVGAVAGGMSYSILTPPGQNNTRSGLSGSQVALKALSEAGKVNVVHTASTVTLNRQPVPVAVTDQKAYVQSMSRVETTGSSENMVVEINPGVVTTGFILNLLPFVTDEDSVLMQFSVDVSSLKMGTFGEGTAQIQTPEVSSMQFLQRVGMKNGQTLVLSGFERNSTQGSSRSLGEQVSPWLGGSQSAGMKKETIVILITPVISEGI